MSFWDVTLSILWFMMLAAWIWLFVVLLADLFRDPETSGWAKASWALFMIVLPWIGCLTYLIVRGKSMNERALKRAGRLEPPYQPPYVQPASAWSTGGGTAGELSQLVDLRDRGAITEQDYQQAKARILASEPAASAAAPSAPAPAQRDRAAATG